MASHLTEDLLADKISKYPLVIVGCLLILVVVLFTLVLQAIGRFDIMANLSEIWFWVAAAVLTFAIGLITRGFFAPRQTKTVLKDEGQRTEPKIAEKLETTSQPLLTYPQYKFREEVRQELLRLLSLIRLRVHQEYQFHAWNETREPDWHKKKHDLIGIKEQDELIESFATVLNNRNDNLASPSFDDLSDECIVLLSALRKTGFFNPEAQPQMEGAEKPTSLPVLNAELRLEPPVGIETVPEPKRSEIIADATAKKFDLRSQQVYVKALNGDLVDSELKISVDGIGIDHMIWGPTPSQSPVKEKLTIQRDDEKLFTLWYAILKDGKEYLYIPITTTPHIPRYIGNNQSPLIVDVWIIAHGYSEKKPRRLIIYRESWEGLLAKQVGDDGIPFAEFDALWHCSAEVGVASSVASDATQESAKASRLHISHRAKAISLIGRMRGLKPSYQYQVEIRPSYTLGKLSPENETIAVRAFFTTNESGEGGWGCGLSADGLVTQGFTRFSVWIGDIPKHTVVFVSDNIPFHN